MYRKYLAIPSPRRKCPGLVAHITLPILAIVSLSFGLAGCGSGSGSSTTKSSGQSGPAILILTQPTSKIVPIDRPATFKIDADGAGMLRYQWTRNGTAIPGATSSTYTLPNVTLADSGGKFQVTVSNTVGSATSQTAVLTAGPRAPKIGDLRYLLWQQVTVPGLGHDGGVVTRVGSGNVIATGAVGPPLRLAPSSHSCDSSDFCSWGVSTDYLPPGQTMELTIGYSSENFENGDTDLQPMNEPNAVITSLALEPQYKTYAISWAQSSQAGKFDYRLQIVPPSDVQSTAALDGANGRVVTAVSFDGPNEVYLISYGWQGSQTTFDVKTTTVTAGNLVAAAKNLAADGYIISAFGGDNTSGWILVGMHAMGYHQPRSLFTNSISNATLRPDTDYFTPVALLDDPANQPAIIGIWEQ